MQIFICEKEIMAKEVEDKAIEWLALLFKTINERVNDYNKYHQKKIDQKAMLKTFNFITNEGKSKPCVMHIAPEGASLAKELEQAIKEYNKKHAAWGSKVHYIPFFTKGNGWNILTNEDGAKIIEKLEREIFKNKHISHLELTDKAFLNEFKGNQGMTFSGISKNEMNLIKSKPWINKNREEALTKFAFSFTSVPKTDNSYEILFNGEDKIIDKEERNNMATKGVYETIMLAKVNLSGRTGNIINMKMDYERDMLSIARNPDSLEKPIYITSATDAGKYIIVSKEGIALHQTVVKNGHYIDQEMFSINKDAISKTEYENRVTDAFKTINNPCIMSDVKECQRHCIEGDILKECYNTKGEKMAPYIVDSKDVAEMNLKFKSATNVMELAKISLKAKGIAEKNLTFGMFASECQQIIQGLTDISKEGIEEKDVNAVCERLGFSKNQYKDIFINTKNELSDCIGQVGFEELKEAFVSAKSLDEKMVSINESYMEFFVSDENMVNQEKFETNKQQIEIEMENFGVDDVLGCSQSFAEKDFQEIEFTS